MYLYLSSCQQWSPSLTLFYLCTSSFPYLNDNPSSLFRSLDFLTYSWSQIIITKHTIFKQLYLKSSKTVFMCVFPLVRSTTYTFKRTDVISKVIEIHIVLWYNIWNLYTLVLFIYSFICFLYSTWSIVPEYYLVTDPFVVPLPSQTPSCYYTFDLSLSDFWPITIS